VAATAEPLSIQARIALPIKLSGGFPSVAAEAPDGAVFVSDPAGSNVWVVDGDRPAVRAEHVAGVTNALAADASSLYVASFTTVCRYDRSNGAKVAQWALPSVKKDSTSDALLVSLTVTPAALWVTQAQGSHVNVYRIDPNSGRAPRLVVRSLGAIVSAGGSLYYERSDAHLVRVAPNGAVRVGPRLADRPNKLGGGVEYLDSVAGGRVWVTEPAGQGLDASYRAFDSTTLAAGATFNGSIGDTMANTLIGPLMLAGAETQSVYRIAADGRLTDPLPLAGGLQLVGPHPAVLSINHTGTGLQIERIS